MQQRYLARLERCFQEIDGEGSGTVDLGEWIIFTGGGVHSVLRKVFSHYSSDGELSVDEFARALWTFLSRGKQGMALFCFELYAAAGKEEIDREALRRMAKDVHNDPTHALEIVSKSPEIVGRAEFLALCTRNAGCSRHCSCSNNGFAERYSESK